MGQRIGAVAIPPVIHAADISGDNPDGVRTLFGVPTAAKPGTLAVLRKPSIAAPAATAGIDVANAGPALVALKSELDNAITVINSIRAALNRSYLRDDPAGYLAGGDVLTGLVATTDASGGGTSLNLATNGNDADAAHCNGGGSADGSSLFFDAGSLLSITGYRTVANNRDPQKDTPITVTIYARAKATDAWTQLANYNSTNGPVQGATSGLYRYFRFQGSGLSFVNAYAWFTCSIFGGLTLGNVTYTTPPAAGEKVGYDEVVG